MFNHDYFNGNIFCISILQAKADEMFERIRNLYIFIKNTVTINFERWSPQTLLFKSFEI